MPLDQQLFPGPITTGTLENSLSMQIHEHYIEQMASKTIEPVPFEEPREYPGWAGLISRGVKRFVAKALTTGMLLSGVAGCTPSGEGSSRPVDLQTPSETSIAHLPVSLDYHLDQNMNACHVVVDGRQRDAVPTGAGSHSYAFDRMSRGSHDVKIACDAPSQSAPEESQTLALSTSDPNTYSYEAGTAADYAASKGLTADVSPYDTNADGPFTDFERRVIDVLAQMRQDGFSTQKIQAFVQAFPNVGQLTAWAMEKSYAAYTAEKQYDSALVFTPQTVGWVDLEGILPDWSLPSSEVTRAQNQGLAPLTNFPVNSQADAPGLTDWSNLTAGVTSTFLSKFHGCTTLSGAEDVVNTGGGDLSFIFTSYTNKPTHQVFASLPGEGQVSILTYPMADENGVNHTDSTIGVSYRILRNDRSAFDAPLARFAFAHVTPENPPDHYDYTAYGYQNSTNDAWIESETELGVVDKRLGSTFELDLSIYAPSDFGFGPYLPRNGDVTSDPLAYVLDFFAAEDYPAGKQPRIVQPKYNQDIRVFAPHLDPMTTTYTNLPNAPTKCE